MFLITASTTNTLADSTLVPRSTVSATNTKTSYDPTDGVTMKTTGSTSDAVTTDKIFLTNFTVSKSHEAELISDNNKLSTTIGRYKTTSYQNISTYKISTDSQTVVYRTSTEEEFSTANPVLNKQSSTETFPTDSSTFFHQRTRGEFSTNNLMVQRGDILSFEIICLI